MIKPSKKHSVIKYFLAVLVISIFLMTIPSQSAQFFWISHPPASQPAQPPFSQSSVPQPASKLSSEEETIDSMNVNPKSGRWDVTDTNTNDYIVDGNLRNINSVNSSSTASSYFAERGLVKSDSKVEYRAKSSVSGNTSEFFRDTLGTPMTFDSSTQGWVTKGTSTVSQENGKLKIVESSSNGGVRYTLSSYVSRNVFTNISFDIYSTSSQAMYVQIYYDAGTFANYYKTFTCSSSVQTINVAFSTFTGSVTKEPILFNRIEIYTQASTTNTFYLDNIQLVGSYDYATSVNGGIENTWDIEDSKENFYDVLGNTSDFNDGTTEGWTLTTDAGSSSFINIDSKYGEINVGVGSTYATLTRNSLSITALTYTYLTVEFYSGAALTNILITDGSNTVCSDSTGWSGGVWSLFSCNLGSDADWTGTETSLSIKFSHSGPANTIDVNAIYLYDASLGNVEGWSNNHAYNYVDPAGYVVNHVTATTNANMVKSSLSIDTAIFKYLTIKIKADSSSNRYFNIYTSNFLISSTALTTSFQTFVFDLSLSAYWTGTISTLYIVFGNATGMSVNTLNSVFTIDYILLTAVPVAQKPFTIGFWDQDNSQSLVNITQSFINTTYSRFEVELYDSGLNIAAYYYSDYYELNNTYYRVKITYNIQKSLFTIEIQDDSQSRLFKASYPNDFTITAQTNALFSMGKPPGIFFSTQASFIGATETWLDFINTPYKENEWRQTASSSDSDWLVQSRLSEVVQPTLTSQTVTYRLNVPQLDALSATMVAIFNQSHLYYSGTSIKSSFNLYVAQTSTGTLYEVFSIIFAIRSGGTYCFPGENPFTKYFYIYNYITSTNSSEFTFPLCVIDPAPLNTTDSNIEFSLTTQKDRSAIALDARMIFNINSAYINDTSQFFNLSSLLSDYSNEFVLEYTNIVSLSASSSGKVYLALAGLQWTARDIFQDIVNGINNIGQSVATGIGNIFSSVFSGFTDIFKKLILWLGDIFKTAVRALDPLLTAISTAVTNIGTQITAAVNSIGNAITIAIGTIGTQVGSAVSGFFETVGGYIQEIGNYVVNAITANLGDLIDDTITFLSGIAGNVWDFIQLLVNLGLTFFGSLWSTAVLYVQQVVTNIFNWLLNIFNLLNLWTYLGQVFTFLVSIVLLIYIFISIALWIGPFWAARTPADLPGNFWNIWSFDVTMGLEILAERVPIPLIAIWLTWTLYLGLFTTIFPSNPF